MRRAVFIQWSPDGADAALARIRAAGWEAEFFRMADGNLGPVRRNPPSAVVIDLSRRPSHGFGMGQALRLSASTRHIPLIFVAGTADTVERVKAVLPDAVFCEWDSVAGALRQAVANVCDEPVVPPGMAAYSGTPLFRKLGIKTGSRLCLIDAPQGFLAKLTVPPGVQIRERAAEAERVLFFARSLKDLHSGFERAGKAVAAKGGLWVLWPKRTSGVETDISQPVIRQYAFDCGWVDYKICSVDDTWSGLLFSRAKRPARVKGRAS